jgi:hypothetical protein
MDCPGNWVRRALELLLKITIKNNRKYRVSRRRFSAPRPFGALDAAATTAQGRTNINAPIPQSKGENRVHP